MTRYPLLFTSPPDQTRQQMVMIALFLISVFTLHHHVEAHVQADQPIAGSSLYYLDSSATNKWHASAQIQTKGSSTTNDLTIPATVPGDLLSDLTAAGIIGEPYYEVNFRNSSLWDDNVWTYTIQFTTSSVLTIDAGVEALLVFDGIKMGAEIELNGIKLGMALDQFSRWEYDVTETLLSPLEDGLNTLEVSFDSATCVNGRFMACTGGWDWAPYTTTRSAGTHANTFTKGLWKSVYVVGMSEGVAISHVVPQIKYRGAYPTQRLVDGAHSGFDVTVRVFFAQLSSAQSSAHSSVVVSGELTVDTEWGSTKTVAVTVPADRTKYVTIDISAEAKDILLWWPNGLGDTHLYQLNVTFTPSSTSTST
jgi:beta-mannosidase